MREASMVQRSIINYNVKGILMLTINIPLLLSLICIILNLSNNNWQGTEEQG